MAGAAESDPKARELAELIREIRERVRSGCPNGDAGGLALPDLMGILHARDIALSKVAAIGTVNPRRPGALNGLIQAVKRALARALAWHVRDQVEFNRGVLAAVEAILEALNENNRALAELAAGVARSADQAAQWAEWRVVWEQRLAATENEFLRTIAELKASFDFRTAQVSDGIQRRLWADLEKVRLEYERIIHAELRLIRQRAALPGISHDAAPAGGAPAPPLDWLRFTDRFRGPEESVREKHRLYVPYFEGCRAVLDLGCGRGEFLEVMRDAGIPARGIERSGEFVALCRSKELEVEAADLLEYLPSLPDESLDGIFCSHVVEHLPPERLLEVVRVAAKKLKAGGVLAIETPNPESLALFATHFYLDPTHVRPVPPALMAFYAEEAGIGRVEVIRRSPAVEDAPSLQSVPQDFRDAFFGALDYALVGRKL